MSSLPSLSAQKSSTAPSNPVDEYILVRKGLPAPTDRVCIPSSMSVSSSSEMSAAEIRAAKAMIKAVPPAQYVGHTRAHPSKVKVKKQFKASTYDICAGRPRASITTPLGQQIQVCMRYDDFAALTSAVGVSGYALAPTLSIFNSYTDFTALFDQYRIDCCEVWFECSVPRISGAVGDLATGIDLDDATAPTTYDRASDLPGAIDCAWTAGRYHKWKPHVATALYSGAFTSFGNEPAGWIDCGSPNVQHYSFKAATAPWGGGATTFKMHLRALVSFRGAII